MRVYIDMDGVMANFIKAFDEQKTEGMAWPQCQARFFENLEPIQDAIECVTWICDNFDTWVLTAPSVENVLCYTEKVVWVREKFPHLDLHQHVIISPDKSCIGNENDILIDDINWTFNGELILFGGKKFPDWTAVCGYLYGKT